MANSRHLKRHSMPKFWNVKRKNIPFISRPQPGSHKREYSTSFLLLLRDELGYVENAREARYAIKETEIILNGERVDDMRKSCGLFDVVEIKATAEKFLVLFNENKRLKLIPVKDNLLFMKVSSKNILPKKKFQLGFANGRTNIVDEKTFKSVAVNDTLVYDFGSKKIVSHIPLKEGTFVYIFDGKYKGNFAEVKSFTKFAGLGKDIARVQIGKEEHSTAMDYCYAVGSKKEDLKRFA